MPLTDGLPQVRFSHRFLSSQPVAFHRHPCPELVMVTQGSCVIQVGKAKLTGRRGDVFLLPAGIPHDQVGTGMVGTLYIGFEPGVERPDDMPQVIPAGQDRYVRDWVKSIVELNRDANASAAVLGGLLVALLARLRHLHRQFADPIVLPQRMEAAMERVRTRLGETLNIRTISRSVGVSPSHLRTLFRQHVGASPTQYQKSLRMNLALQRLVDPYPSIKEIAAECGYRDVNLFIRLFRKQHGQSPGRWRRNAAGRD